MAMVHDAGWHVSLQRQRHASNAQRNLRDFTQTHAARVLLIAAIVRCKIGSATTFSARAANVVRLRVTHQP
jgi:hypothetical protein